MKRKKSPRTPSLRHHKATGQGFVELDGRRVYLGAIDNPEIRERYHRTIAESESNGRRLPVDPHDITVAELLAAFGRHAATYYGSASGESAQFRLATRPLKRLYGTARVVDFGQPALKSVRQQFIDNGGARSYVNSLTGRIRRVVRWGVENEIVPPGALHGLEAVAGIRAGRMEIRECEPVTAAPAATVEATLPHRTPTLCGMVQGQRLTGMRPSELCIMRGCDLDTTGTVWVYPQVA